MVATQLEGLCYHVSFFLVAFRNGPCFPDFVLEWISERRQDLTVLDLRKWSSISLIMKPA